MNKDFEIAVTLNTDEANEKLEQLTAKAQGLADLFTSIAEQADRAAKIMPPSTVVDAVYAMGRPPKRNLNYSTWDVDVLENDTSIDNLIDAQGPAGFYVYFALCQKAYATDGYFYRWGYDNAASTARKLGGGLKSTQVRAIVDLCVSLGLFDKALEHPEGTNMNLIQDVLSAASTQPEQDHFARIKLADILPDPENFYETDGIEELAAAIDAFGLEQPLVVRPADESGKYRLTGGHRRRLALLTLYAKDPERWAEVGIPTCGRQPPCRTCIHTCCATLTPQRSITQE